MSAALQRVLDETRLRFVDTFDGQCASIRILIDEVDRLGAGGPVAALTQAAHRLSGLAGTIGFPTISARASELEHMIDGVSGGAFDVSLARDVVARLGEAFTRDLARPPAWMPPVVAGTGPIPLATRDVVPALRTIVLADDDPDVTRMVDSQARGAGYRTVLALDGEQALAAVRAHAPDALVLDLMMPKLNGFDVLTQIHEGPAPRPRIIVLSGRGREQDVMRAFDLGADDYMTKPFNPQELMARIARLIT